MVQTTGQEFLNVWRATAWEPGMPRKEQPLHEAMSLFDGRFLDTEDTIVIIDEIQDSAKVYSLIRQFAREFSCHFVIFWAVIWENPVQSIFSRLAIWIL